MDENPYKPPKEYDDIPEGAWVRAVNAILNVVVALFLTVMALVSLFFLAVGALGFLGGDIEAGILAFPIGAVLGLLTYGAILQTLRRKR